VASTTYGGYPINKLLVLVHSFAAHRTRGAWRKFRAHFVELRVVLLEKVLQEEDLAVVLRRGVVAQLGLLADGLVEPVKCTTS